MYFYLFNLAKARDISTTQNIPLSDVLLNHSLILKNILFKPRGNCYLSENEIGETSLK